MFAKLSLNPYNWFIFSNWTFKTTFEIIFYCVNIGVAIFFNVSRGGLWVDENMDQGLLVDENSYKMHIT